MTDDIHEKSDSPAPELPGVKVGFLRIVSLGRSPTEIAAEVPPPSARSPHRPGGFRQTQLIRVGQTHLATADVTDDGAYLLAVSDDEALVRIYDARGQLVSRFPVPGFSQFGRGSFSFFPGQGRPRVLAATDNGLDLYDALSGDLVAHLDDQPTWAVRWSIGRRVLLALSSDIGTQTSSLILFEALAEGRLAPLAHAASDERIDGVDLSDDGQLLAVTTYPSNSLQLIDLAAMTERWTTTGPPYMRPVDISPDGQLVAVGGDRLVLFNAADPAKKAELTGYGNNLHEVRFLEGNDEIVSTSYDGRVRIAAIDPDKPALRLVQTLRHSGTANVYAIVVRDSGDEILTSSGDKSVRRFSRRPR